MTHAQVTAALRQLDLNAWGASQLFHHDQSAILRWCSGARGIPQGVAILLQLLLDGRITVADVRAAAERAFAE